MLSSVRIGEAGCPPPHGLCRTSRMDGVGASSSLRIRVFRQRRDHKRLHCQLRPCRPPVGACGHQRRFGRIEINRAAVFGARD